MKPDRSHWPFVTAATTAIAIAALMAVSPSAFAQTQKTSALETPSAWKPVEDAIGRSGQMQPGDVIKFSMPRRSSRFAARRGDQSPACSRIMGRVQKKRKRSHGHG